MRRHLRSCLFVSGCLAVGFVAIANTIPKGSGDGLKKGDAGPVGDTGPDGYGDASQPEDGSPGGDTYLGGNGDASKTGDTSLGEDAGSVGHEPESEEDGGGLQGAEGD